ncbi:Coiled-coil domain-containing protein 124-Oxs1 [Babesia duncani]|uniref:Coiled-coil domain-containing protein 124-Oxs1 n=1 Tax=Babesia duncani TaxID=323732 RepID=A0AAD9UQN5_9APIC|nr:Coiled-coil domain-containing protein 124-Oxs1 [Babesia duncani]
MPKHSGVNSKALEALIRKKEQKEALRRQKEAEELDKFWADDDKLTNAKLQRRHQAPKKPTRAEILRNQLLQQELSRKQSLESQDSYSVEQLLQPNPNREALREQLELEEQNIESVKASGLDDILSALSIAPSEGGDKRVKAAFIAFQERKMAELKVEYPNLKLSQYKDMIYKSWQRSPENPSNNR